MKSENTVKKQSAGYILQKFSAIVILLAIIVIMSIGSENFFSGKNFLNILNQSAVLGIMAIGMTFVTVSYTHLPWESGVSANPSADNF